MRQQDGACLSQASHKYSSAVPSYRMRRITASSLFVLFSFLFLLVRSQDFSNFFQPYSDTSLRNFNMLQRDDKCGNSCSGMGENVCCGKKASCALDSAGNVACCPFNAVCTGAISPPTGASLVTAKGATSGAAATGVPPTAAPSAIVSHAISGTSTVPNSYYPFPVAPTTFANAGDCSSTFSGCQAESAKCTGFIEGGGYGVTINGVGVGVTQQGGMPPASAESICSSLSQAACHGLKVEMCSTLGGSAMATSDTNAFVLGSSSKGAAPTRCLGVYGVGVGIAVGIAGQAVR